MDFTCDNRMTAGTRDSSQEFPAVTNDFLFLLLFLIPIPFPWSCMWRTVDPTSGKWINIGSTVVDECWVVGGFLSLAQQLFSSTHAKECWTCTWWSWETVVTSDWLAISFPEPLEPSQSQFPEHQAICHCLRRNLYSKKQIANQEVVWERIYKR